MQLGGIPLSLLFLVLTSFRWLFFVEGSLTIIVAILAMFVLPDFPETSTGWLTPAEKNIALRRIAEDVAVPDKEDLPGSSGLTLAISDPKVWWLAATLSSLVLSLSFNAYFPTLMSTIGYTSTTTLLLCVPPWIFATLVAIFMSRHSDHTAERCGHITISFGFGILGFLLAISTMNPVIRYSSLCVFIFNTSCASEPSEAFSWRNLMPGLFVFWHGRRRPSALHLNVLWVSP